MKGDFSRSTFRREKHYTSVRMQQGRVLLDAESNEHADIQNYLRHTTARDLIGRSGAPRDDAGFRIGWLGTDLLISAGRFYVDGILCECEGARVDVVQPAAPAPGPATITLQSWAPQLVDNAFVEVNGRDTNDAPVVELREITTADEAARTLSFAPALASFATVLFVRTTVRYTQQPDLLDPPAIAGDDHLVYLDVWQRHITAVEDPSIRELALGIPDTTTRTRTVWQVRLAPAQACRDFTIAPSGALLQARTQPATAPATPCEIPSAAGYRRLENQLYRVEIHDGGATPTFKWSRDNGSLVYPIEASVDTDEVRLRTTGLDERTSLRVNDWVEVIDDVRELQGRPGIMRRIAAPPADAIVRLDSDIAGIDFARNPRLRLWARNDAAAAVRALTDGADADGYVALEDGIQVRFSGSNFRSGDYWLIAARTAISTETGNIEWPRVANVPVALPPEGIVHHYAPLAEINSGVVEDCRPIFAPASTPDLFYAGGDGQEIMPAPAGAAAPALPQQLRAIVSNGTPVPGAFVRFTVTSTNGGTVASGGNSGTTITVETGSDGLASCTWTVNSTDLSQTVSATLVGLSTPGYVPGLPPIIYNAHLSVASNVRYTPGCTFLANTDTVQEALDALCNRPSGEGPCTVVLSPGDDVAGILNALPDERVEICFRPGLFEIREPVRMSKRSILITGAGEGTFIEAVPSVALEFQKCESVIIRDIALRTIGQIPPQTQVSGAFHFQSCNEIVLEQLSVDLRHVGQPVARACIFADSSARVSIHRCALLTFAPLQMGIFLSNPSIAILEENHINGPFVPDEDRFRRIRETLIVNPVVGTTAPRTNNVRVRFGEVPVSFRMDPRLAEEMRPFLEELDASDVNTPADAEQFLDAAMMRLVTDMGLRDRFPRLAEVIGDLLPEAVAQRADVGIDVRGERIGSVTIRDNHVSGVLIGIRAGASGRAVRDGQRPDTLQRAVIEANEVSVVLLESDSATQAPGISVGTCASLLVSGNRVAASRRFDNVGIRVEGRLGLFTVIRANHVSRCGVAVRATNVAALPQTRQWLLAENLGTDGGYDATDFAMVNNVP